MSTKKTSIEDFLKLSRNILYAEEVPESSVLKKIVTNERQYSLNRFFNVQKTSLCKTYSYRYKYRLSGEEKLHTIVYIVYQSKYSIPQ